MSHRAFSNAAKERMTQPGSPMRRNDNQIGACLCSGFIDGYRAVSGNGRCTDWNAIRNRHVSGKLASDPDIDVGLRPYKSANGIRRSPWSS